MVTTAIVGDDTTTIVEDEGPRFEWSAVLAGAVAAAATTLFLFLVGAALGLSLAGTRNPTGAHTFLTIGAIYFLAAEAFGFAIGGHITGRLMRPAPESEEEHFRADAHGLTVWGLSAIFGISLAALMAAAGIGQAAQPAAPAAAYWADKLFAGGEPMQQGMPLAVAAERRDEAARILPVDAARAPGTASDDRSELARLVAMQTGASAATADARVANVEDGMRAQADAARRAALYVAMWTVFALLFGCFVTIATTLHARWHKP